MLHGIVPSPIIRTNPYVPALTVYISSRYNYCSHCYPHHYVSIAFRVRLYMDRRSVLAGKYCCSADLGKTVRHLG